MILNSGLSIEDKSRKYFTILISGKRKLLFFQKVVRDCWNIIESFHRKYINNDRISNLQIFGIEIDRCAEKHGLHSTSITLTARGKGVPVCRNWEPEVECVSVYLINFILYNMGLVATLINGIEQQLQKYNPVACSSNK